MLQICRLGTRRFFPPIGIRRKAVWQKRLFSIEDGPKPSESIRGKLSFDKEVPKDGDSQKRSSTFGRIVDMYTNPERKRDPMAKFNLITLCIALMGILYFQIGGEQEELLLFKKRVFIPKRKNIPPMKKPNGALSKTHSDVQLVKSIGSKLLSGNGLSGKRREQRNTLKWNTNFTWTFYVVDIAEPVCYSHPLGTITISTGMLSTIGRDPDVLAGVLSREIAHCLCFHGLLDAPSSQFFYGFMRAIGFKKNAFFKSRLQNFPINPENERFMKEADYCSIHLLTRSCFDPSEYYTFLDEERIPLKPEFTRERIQSIKSFVEEHKKNFDTNCVKNGKRQSYNMTVTPEFFLNCLNGTVENVGSKSIPVVSESITSDQTVFPMNEFGSRNRLKGQDSSSFFTDGPSHSKSFYSGGFFSETSPKSSKVFVGVNDSVVIEDSYERKFGDETAVKEFVVIGDSDERKFGETAVKEFVVTGDSDERKYGDETAVNVDEFVATDEFIFDKSLE